MRESWGVRRGADYPEGQGYILLRRRSRNSVSEAKYREEGEGERSGGGGGGGGGGGRRGGSRKRDVVVVRAVR